MANEYKYLDPDGLARFKSKIQDILDRKVDKETGKYIVTVDESLSTTSTNPVRNSAVTVALNGKLGTSGDSKDNTVSFTSGDVANDAAATSWTADVGTISSGLTHANLFNRLSLEVKNLRYLKNLLGSTDISAIGGGTVTGALLKLNTDLTNPELVTDCNNATDPRKIYWTNGNTAHVPDDTGLWWTIRVVAKRNNNLTQMAYRLNNNAMSESPIYTRYLAGDSWSNWFQLPTRAEIDQLNTDKANLSYLSNQNGQVFKALHFDLNLNKTLTLTVTQPYPIFFLFGQSVEPIAYIIIGQNVTNSGSGMITRLDRGTGASIALSTEKQAGKLILKMPAAYYNICLFTMNEVSVTMSA